ncbi:N-acylglucosamine 2-epimerase-like isoform X2 [Corticium candelabrum]|uniref:N-acylglucosamine 2-epimerase-like isoform X2 n=1 Tax=Corticium candelabrum TaxID=121492 RepID=UPI002E269CEF|nr:N-acylglucosamine 2-epimerase-like isoform X2 [Corticium candelabrum]
MAARPLPLLSEYLTKMQKELKRVMDFWLRHSHDEERGGFLVSLTRDGKVYDTVKYGWLQGRQVWMYCKLYNETEEYHTDQVLQAAIDGAKFLKEFFYRSEDNRCYFTVTREGLPIYLQRTMATEAFYVIAMAELSRATKQQHYMDEAEKVLSSMLHWARVDDSQLGRPYLAGSPPINSMVIPMLVFNVVHEVCGTDEKLAAKYREHTDWAAEQTLAHVQRGGTVVLENVSISGEELGGCKGRHINPGHAIEAGWFLLQHASLTNKQHLKRVAIETFMLRSFERGWDEKDGGIFYFLDVDGYSPTALEWNMKLWWPHCEALIAFLMAYQETGEAKLLEQFGRVFDYTFSHFVDEDHGEWFGYLNRDSTVSMDFKGGPYKGCFHVPRCLHYCIQILKKLTK